MCMERENFLLSLPRNKFQEEAALSSIPVPLTAFVRALSVYTSQNRSGSHSPSTPTKTSEAGSASLLKAAAVSPVVFKCLKIQSGQNRSRFDTYLRTMKIGRGAR